MVWSTIPSKSPEWKALAVPVHKFEPLILHRLNNLEEKRMSILSKKDGICSQPYSDAFKTIKAS